jgi:hypothetical protein
MKKKIILAIFSIIIIFSVSATLLTYLYTQDKVADFGKSVGSYSFYNGNLYLGELLNINFDYEHIDYGSSAPKNKWRDLLASDPSLAYSAFDLYSSTFVENFKKGFENTKKTYITNLVISTEQNKEFLVESALSKNPDDFLKFCLGGMKKYQILIDDLLILDDKTLNNYISTVRSDYCCSYESNESDATDFKIWLARNGHITNNDDMKNRGLPSFYNFPTDMLLLTYRISSNYPSWSNRRVLQEMKKFSIHVQNKMIK